MKLKTLTTNLALLPISKPFIGSIFITFVVLFFGYIFSAQAQSVSQTATETLNVPFTKYQSVKTAEEYSGLVVIVVSGVGQASGSDYTDAFYRYTGSGLDLKQPVHANEFGLEIDGIRSVDVVESIPEYASDHIYVFTYDAGQIPHSIGLSIGETGLRDNTGKFTVRVMPLS